MTEQLKEIGMRLASLRETSGLTAEQMAEKMDLDLEEYLNYEKGEEDFSFSFLSNAAEMLGVDVVELITGDAPKLTICSLVRRAEATTSSGMRPMTTSTWPLHSKINWRSRLW